jgi:hypothetical protein
MWNSVDNPPSGNPNQWTRHVVAVADTGGVYRVAYYHGKEGGNWQRPERLIKEGGKLIFWTELPEQIRGKRNHDR